MHALYGGSAPSIDFGYQKTEAMYAANRTRTLANTFKSNWSTEAEPTGSLHTTRFHDLKTFIPSH